MGIDTRDATAAGSSRAIVELVLSELPEPPAPHTELAQVAAAGSAPAGEAGCWPGATHAVDARRAPPVPRVPARAVHLLRALRARLRRGPGRFALTATGRGFSANMTAGLDAGFQESTLRLVRRLRRHLPDGRDHRDDAAYTERKR